MDPLRVPTSAWRLANDHGALVDAADVGRLTPGLAALARAADILVIDGVVGAHLFAHLRGDHAIPSQLVHGHLRPVTDRAALDVKAASSRLG